jgi:nucleotide-binding universal stress UspA family protein
MRHILVCLDGSNLAKKVMPYAFAIARNFDCHITLLHVLEHQHVDPCKPIDPVAWEMQKREAISHLKAIEACAVGFSITSVVIEGKPAEQINDWINKNNVDLTVLCSHGENGPSQWPIASTTQKLIASSSGAIFLVPASCLERDEQRDINYKRLLVPLDSSSWADSALPFAINIANNPQSEIILVQYLPEPGLIQIGSLDAEANLLENRIVKYNTRIAQKNLEKTKFWLQSSTSAEIKYLIVTGRGVGQEMANLVESEAVDLVVMSANGNIDRSEKFYGKVTPKLLIHSQVPVVLLRGRALETEGLDHCLSDSLARFPSRASL